MRTVADLKWVAPSLPTAIAVALAAISALAAYSASLYCGRSERLASRIRVLEASLKASLEKVDCERRGRIRAQQALREALLKRRSVEATDGASPPAGTCSYPMVPIGTVRSCFTTRNGTPRQSFVVPLARACLMLNPNRAPADALEGLADYSHCWLLYVFHLNTDLEKLWKPSCRSKFKAKVRVPRLKGGKLGVLATRSPHRPCPIGLTVAKVEAVDGCAIRLSGVDLVDGTPVLDIKPYLPYSDNVKGARIPKWLEEDTTLGVSSVSFSPVFQSSLAECWEASKAHSMYASVDELACLVKQVLSWDIRSFAQRSRSHHVGPFSNLDEDENEGMGTEDGSTSCNSSESMICHQASKAIRATTPFTEGVIYHLVLEGIDIAYQIDDDSNVVVERATICNKNHSSSPSSTAENGRSDLQIL